MLLPEAFVPECIDPEYWPPAHKEAWRQLFIENDLFDKNKPTLKWRYDTINKVQKGYGIWLSFNSQCSLDITHTQPAELVTQASVLAYREAFIKRNAADLTIFSHINELYLAIKNLSPNNDWSWLKRASNNLRNRAQQRKEKLPRLKSSDKLINCGYSFMNEAERNKNLSPYKRAIFFRDGLMIALLAYRPVRAKNFVNIKINENLIQTGGQWLIRFSPRETKNRKHFEAEFPIDLVEELEKYLSIYRPFLLSLGHSSGHKIQTDPTNYLWISNEGRNLDIGSFTVAIKRRTEQYFGAYIYPHLFRDASVTTLVRHEPASAKLTKSVLGHNSIEITNRHYNQSKMIEAARKHLSYIDSIIG